VRADWLVACDGGASFIRRALNIPFEGKTAPNQWIVIDIANDPLATPHVYLCCDPVRPTFPPRCRTAYAALNLW
jgi:3-(3-hydroxy-phenyl)propionate hydroxylase